MLKWKQIIDRMLFSWSQSWWRLKHLNLLSCITHLRLHPMPPYLLLLLQQLFCWMECRVQSYAVFWWLCSGSSVAGWPTIFFTTRFSPIACTTTWLAFALVTFGRASQQHVGKPSITIIMPHQTWCILRLEDGGDPDTSTMPLLLWSEKIIEDDSEDLKDLPRFMVRHQKPVLLPSTDGLYSNIMAAAVTSLSTGPVHKYVGGLPMKIAEISTFALHYAAVVYITTLLKKKQPYGSFFTLFAIHLAASSSRWCSPLDSGFSKFLASFSKFRF